jgi:hypothetical protein
MRRQSLAYFFDNRVTSLPRLCEILQHHDRNVIPVFDIAAVPDNQFCQRRIIASTGEVAAMANEELYLCCFLSLETFGALVPARRSTSSNLARITRSQVYASSLCAFAGTSKSSCSAKLPGSVRGANAVSSTKKKHPIPPTMTPIKNAAGTITAVSIWSELYNVAGPRRRSAPGARSLSWGPLWMLENDTLPVPTTLMPHDSA